MVNRFEEGEPARCDCECHENPMVKHVMACCQECEKCGQRFTAGLTKHRETCAG